MRGSCSRGEGSGDKQPESPGSACSLEARGSLGACCGPWVLAVQEPARSVTVQKAPPHAHVSTHMHTCTRACTHMRTRTHTHGRACMHTRAHTHMYTRTHTYTWARTHAHAHTHTCTRTHTRTHVRTQIPRRLFENCAQAVDVHKIPRTCPWPSVPVGN